jgi:hypothetical protein
MALKKRTLTLESDCDFSIIGISCHIADYRFVHFLNKIHNFNFVRLDEFEFFVKSIKDSLKFPFYLFDDNENYTSYYVIANRSKDGILVNEWKMFDYLMISNSNLNEVKLKALTALLRNIPGVLAISNLQIEKKTEVEKLLADIEIYILNFHKRVRLNNSN